ncbi:MAG: DUF3619 family protein [Rhodoferax sp.]|uniref:DUF3619 family protein n=1 Tax=Rhodoferax sp. TaxID=50421 RepID=UPI00260FE21B|nr:DUF3619 family protein [Rhodoferax sp.]MDD2879052.1 DUF3619 family protein [Rhodoferax sp.]
MNSLSLRSSENDDDALGARITARLTEATDQLPHDISERLRAARVQAVEKRKQMLLQSSAVLFNNDRSGTLTATRAGGHSNWWNRLGAAGLLLVLAAGMLVINVVQNDIGASELADIDTAILTDDLPPAAYVDAGFVQFLKIGNRQEP